MAHRSQRVAAPVKGQFSAAPRMTQDVSAVVVQGGPTAWKPRGNAAALASFVDAELQRQAADLVVLSELALTPYFAASRDRNWLTAGHEIDDDEIDILAQVARRHRSHIVVSFAERDRATDRLHNSILILDRAGEIVPGVLCSGPLAGTAARTFRKVHLSENNNTQPGVHEKYFFNPGNGFAIFDTELGRIGPMICYDRSFPESWRAVADAGAQIVPVPIATARPERVRLLQAELTVAAVQNGVFVLAACKGGDEAGPDGVTTFSGGSSIVSPSGTVINHATANGGPIALRAVLEARELDLHARTFHYRRDRRADAYRAPDELPTQDRPAGPDDEGATQ